MNFLSILFGKKDNTALENALRNNPYLVDVRTSGEFASGSIAGAVNIPLNVLKDHLPKFQNKKNIVVFCKSGTRSAMAKATLERNGINGVTNGGGFQNVLRVKEKL